MLYPHDNRFFRKRISVTLIPDRAMWRGGTNDPVVQISVAAIGIFSNESTGSYSGKITEFIQAGTGLPLDRYQMPLT